PSSPAGPWPEERPGRPSAPLWASAGRPPGSGSGAGSPPPSSGIARNSRGGAAASWKEGPMADVSGEGPATPGGTERSLADRARDIAERANRLLADAEEAARAGEELTYIEDRLAALEEEQRRLDQEFVTVGAGEATAEAGDAPPGLTGPETTSRPRNRGLSDWIEG